MRQQVTIDGKTFSRDTIEKAVQALAEPLPPTFQQGDFVIIMDTESRQQGKVGLVLSAGAALAVTKVGLNYPDKDGIAMVMIEGPERGSVYSYRPEHLMLHASLTALPRK